VLADLRGENGRGEVRGHGRGSERDRRGDRIALLRHGGRAAAAGRGRLERLGHVGLHQQCHVAGELAAAAGKYRQRRGDLGEPVAMAVPRRVRQRQLELGRELFGDRKPGVAERGERAGGAAELEHQVLTSQPRKPGARARERGAVAGELEPERDRQRVLQPGAAGDRRRAVALRLRGEARARAVEIGDERVDDGRKLQHLGGVDDVLAGRAPMDEARRFGGRLLHLGSQRLDQRDCEVAGGDRRLRERIEVEPVRPARGHDRRHRRSRDHSGRGFRARQRRLHVQHALDARAVREDRAHRGAREQRAMEAEGGNGIGHGRMRPARVDLCQRRANPG